MLQYNQCFGDKKQLTKQFEEVRRLNPRQSKPVLHITLSMAPGEQLPRRELHTLVEACAKHMGFDKNQYVAVEHIDTKHQHLHIVANRVGYDGGVVSDSYSYKRITGFCRQMEKELGLKPVLSPKAFLPKELRHLPRNDTRKKALRKHLQARLLQAYNYDSFEGAMKALGYRVERGRGIAFIDEKGVRIKGSEVGYPLARIERILGQNQSALLLKKKEESGFDAKVVKELLQTELENLKRELIQSTPEEKKSWTLFSNDFQAQTSRLLLKQSANGSRLSVEVFTSCLRCFLFGNSPFQRQF